MKRLGSLALAGAALLVLATPAPAHAARAKKHDKATEEQQQQQTTEAAPANTTTEVRTETVKTETTTVSEPKVAVATEVHHEDVGTGSLSMRGGATLGSGMGLRVQFNGATGQDINVGSLGAEVGMYFAVTEHFDIGFNARIPLWNVGFSPGLALRWAFINDGRFHLALVGNLQLPMIYYPGFWIGLSVEPGVMMSYFVNDNVELFGGLLFAYAPIFQNPWVPGTGNAGFIGTARAGLAYTLTGGRTGFFINVDIMGGYEPIRRFIVFGDRASGMAFNAGISAGAQFKF